MTCIVFDVLNPINEKVAVYMFDGVQPKAAGSGGFECPLPPALELVAHFRMIKIQIAAH